MEKLSGTSSGNPRKSLEDEDLMERSVKKKSKTQKAEATDATDETMEDAPTVDQSLGDPIANSEGGQIPTDETKKVDEPKGAAYTVQEDIPPNESDWAMEEWGDWREHPNDPPHYGALEDDMEEEYFVEYG
nr:hypothetical protein Iba_chr14dCG1600 [Ipomoea batatas]